MSHESTPISPARFAAALKDLPLTSLHLKAAELRNSIAHLDYSNEQLRPFADGTSSSIQGESGAGEPDQDCIEAIRENETVIARMLQRLALLKAEVESRGSSWMEFQSAEDIVAEETKKTDSMVNGDEYRNDDAEAEGRRSEAWRDGTFQTGRIVDGQVTMDGATTANGSGGRLDDAELRRAMEERMMTLGEEGDDEDEGMHL